MNIDYTFPVDQQDQILVVDDAYENLCFIQAVLETEGYQVSLAENGKVALEQVQISVPHLVLSDVMMPGMDGIELTRHIRKQKELPFIPILLITAQEQSDVVEGLDAGADDFIRKPVEVTELLARVRSLLRLKHSIDEREQMTVMREEFVYRLTHDLRIPLVAADRMFVLLERGKYGAIPDQCQTVIATMKDSNHDLLQMTNTLLEIYKYEAGQKALPYTTFDVKQLAESVIEELRPLAEEKELELTIVVKSNSNSIHDFQLSGARLELRRVITNLVGNAIKFTDNGSIQIQLDRQSNYLTIKVDDTGCGISDEEQPIVFEREFQGNHRCSGNGLGLNLVRQIIEAHQGMVEVKSQVGKGSSFKVRIPT
ncbi:hybrid sensor histidine kinase/response regulator (plasmid) [Acaryochloris sp. 'Moss Beach']|uniref:sensor histidine kinase n=1 Tax=Acaryochloris TaxID=155977 RepID=UPI001BAF057A|nr:MULTISPECIES: hybrid sensor histidine kinase/response regulator [Acaryochloris]QUY40337.1 hybrid sensor histidine kinase/response regulator [Acaryochloris marina S15]UJB72249.1 hybrid sensor histidine kinase/response regulator [Acaryochloris sp. 'Moss Beach']